MITSKFLDQSFEKLIQLGKDKNTEYLSNAPFPNTYFDNFFNPEELKKVLAEFPTLGDKNDIKFENPNEFKLASKGEYRFGPQATEFAHFMNSQPMLDFLSQLTGIQNLIPDPSFEGGGFHQILPGGFLKIHADFNKHRMTGLDRRLNVLVYLNEDWEESYGGHFELWDTEMKGCVKRILPLFNRMAMFSTTDFSYHGHPDQLTCPPDRSRKSMAFYYYTNGRPAEEVEQGKESRINTKFVARQGVDSSKMQTYNSTVQILQDLCPPLILRAWKNWRR
ncbi:MAG TPA: 2OG-Fe(II) oxygenase [Chitinophagales bacterium]|nr:2OG-Fe(II) oxygenase [Chitinophagales bacterium]